MVYKSEGMSLKNIKIIVITVVATVGTLGLLALLGNQGTSGNKQVTSSSNTQEAAVKTSEPNGTYVLKQGPNGESADASLIIDGDNVIVVNSGSRNKIATVDRAEKEIKLLEPDAPVLNFDLAGDKLTLYTAEAPDQKPVFGKDTNEKNVSLAMSNAAVVEIGQKINEVINRAKNVEIYKLRDKLYEEKKKFENKYSELTIITNYFDSNGNQVLPDVEEDQVVKLLSLTHRQGDLAAREEDDVFEIEIEVKK